MTCRTTVPNLPNLRRVRACEETAASTASRSCARTWRFGRFGSTDPVEVGEAPWISTAWGVLAEAARLGPCVDARAWSAGVARLRAAYGVDVTGARAPRAAHARDRLEALETYADVVAIRAQRSGRVPYRLKEADWSGRVILEEPPWQSVTKDGDQMLRKAVVAPPGCRILCADWHASQLHLLAGLSGDRQLRADLEAGDIYERLGEALAKGHPRGRDLGKLLVLAMTYRAGAKTLVERARDKGVELRHGQVVDLLGRLRARYATLWSWGDAQAAVGRHLLWTPGGRRVQLRPATAPRPGTKRHPRPPALPTLLAGIAQAWEADALLLSLATLAPHLDPLGLTLVLHLHDCTVWEVQEARTDHARIAVTNVMQAAHAWVQQWEPRPGAPPRDRGEGSWAGALVATAIGESWGESSPKCGRDAEPPNHPAPPRCAAQPTRTNRGSERDGETP